MELFFYQARANSTAQYPGRKSLMGLLYVSLGLAGEAGEIANKVKKILRDDYGKVTSERREELLDEAGDCLWYISQLAEELNCLLNKVAEQNIAKLQKRQQSNKIQGSGDDR